MDKSAEAEKMINEKLMSTCSWCTNKATKFLINQAFCNTCAKDFARLHKQFLPCQAASNYKKAKTV